MSSIRTSWAALAGALLVAVAPAATASPASAAFKPPAYSFQKASFKFSFKGTQITQWQRDPRATTRDCIPTVKWSGGGKETVRLRTTKALQLDAYRTNGRTSVALRASKSGLPNELHASVTRSASERYEEVAGSCGGNPGKVTEGGPYDCGDRSRDFGLALGYERGRIEPRFEDSILAPLTDVDYRKCPIHADPKVEVNGFTRVSQALPAKDLFDRSLGRHIVIGRRTFTLHEAGFTGKTTVRWEITLTRRKG